MNNELFWIIKLPLVLAKTFYHKIASIINKSDYEEHIKRVYADKLFTDASDKLHKYRRLVSEYAFDKGKNKSVLDIATGAGWQAFDLVEIGFRKIVAIDLEKKRIEYCKSRSKNSGIEFRLMDMTRLVFKNDEFDAVVITAGLHDLPKNIQKKAISEACRIAKNTVVIFEPRNFSPGSLFGQIYSLIGGLLDETMSFRDYVYNNIEDIFTLNNFSLDIKRIVWGRLMEIKVFGRKS